MNAWSQRHACTSSYDATVVCTLVCSLRGNLFIYLQRLVRATQKRSETTNNSDTQPLPKKWEKASPLLADARCGPLFVFLTVFLFRFCCSVVVSFTFCPFVFSVFYFQAALRFPIRQPLPPPPPHSPRPSPIIPSAYKNLN